VFSSPAARIRGVRGAVNVPVCYKFPVQPRNRRSEAAVALSAKPSIDLPLNEPAVTESLSMSQNLTRPLDDLESCKHCYGKSCAAKVEKILGHLRNANFDDAASLVRFHDVLLFLRAFPQSARVARLADSLLSGVGSRVQHLRENGNDLELFDDEEFSGVANTVVRDTSTYDVACWLEKHYARHITVNWDIDEQGRQMSSSLPPYLPLLADDCLVEADTPYLKWLASAAGDNDKILPWILQRIKSLPRSPVEKTALYDALRIELAWDLGDLPVSRTLARRNPEQIYYHREPLLQRRQVSLADELNSPALPLRRLSRKEGEEILDMARAILAVRYRELYGTTRADPESVMAADVGRGVQIFLWGIPPERRLPLRAYHAGTTLKNGVPINYLEAISLFEWTEVGFNTFYAFREGETAWIYARILHLLHQVTGVTTFSAYPYQLGHENEEAIRSGAFWFYRKLGFRSGRPELLALAQREEAKMARDPGHRTSAATLRKLAAHHAFYEFGPQPHGLWDTFSTRNLGFAVQRKMASEFGGDPEKMRKDTVTAISKTLGLSPTRLNSLERAVLDDFAPLLSLVPDLSRWTKSEKQALVAVIQAKAAKNEVEYLRKLQHHDKLRNALLRLSSNHQPADA
jgi:hypothetical protein